MTTRKLIISALFLLAGCGEEQAANQARPVPPETTAAAPIEDDRIECALAGKGDFERSCALERVETAQGLTLVLRAPDGGFRRLLVTRDGRGVAAADGSEVAKVTPIDAGRIEVELGGDRYRLPATVKQPG